jgi:hypothetical protein
LVECLGLPVLTSADDDATIQAFLAGPWPGALDFELEGVATSLSSGAAYDLDGLLAHLATIGVVSKADGQPISRATWDAAIDAAATDSGPRRIIPGLLKAIEAERGERAVVSAAGQLDALQLLFVNLGLEAASRARTAVHGAKFGTPAMELGSVVDILGYLDNAIRLPFTENAFAVCSAAIGGFTAISLIESPPDVWHRWPGRPDTASLEATVTFTHQFTSRQSAVLEALSCPPPQKGPIGGKTTRWFLEGHAPDHGGFTRQTSPTTEAGHAEADYQTVAETTDEEDQTPENERIEAATVAVQVTDLLPNYPGMSTIQRAAWGTLAVPNSANPASSIDFNVHWYKPMDYRINNIPQVIGSQVRVTSTKCGHAGGVWAISLNGMAGGGTLDFRGTIRLELDKVTLKGTFEGAFEATAFVGPAGATGIFDGTAELHITRPDPSSDPTRAEIVLTTTVQSDIGYARGFFRPGPDGKTATMTIPVKVGKFCP